MKKSQLLEVYFTPLYDNIVEVSLWYDNYTRLIQFQINDVFSYDMLLDILGLVSVQVHRNEYYIRFKPKTSFFRIMTNIEILKLPFTSTYVDKNSSIYLLCQSLC